MAPATLTSMSSPSSVRSIAAARTHTEGRACCWLLALALVLAKEAAGRATDAQRGVAARAGAEVAAPTQRPARAARAMLAGFDGYE